MAQVRIRDGAGTLRTIARIRMRDADNILRTIQRIRIRDATGVLRTVFQYIVASLSPSTISKTGTTATIISAAAAVSVTGGVAPYTYDWTATDDFADGVAATTPTASSTTFRRTSTIVGDTYLGRFFCRVTDATGASTDTGIVDVDITRT